MSWPEPPMWRTRDHTLATEGLPSGLAATEVVEKVWIGKLNCYYHTAGFQRVTVLIPIDAPMVCLGVV